MKILITAPSLDEKENVSGISTLVRHIIRHGDREFCHFAAGRKDDESFGVSWLFRQILLPLRFCWQIISTKPNVIHINTAFVPLSIVRDASLTAAARLAGRPVLLHPNGGRFLVEEFESRTLAWITGKMLRMASKVLVLSDIEKESLVHRWPGLNVSILPNAIALDEIPEINRSADEKNIIFLGRIHESKGLHEIIEACRILKNEGLQFRFNCFGAGPQKEFFLAEMANVLIDKFSYGGVVFGAEKQRALAESHIFLLPSRYGEGLPLAMLEAMAARCVVVVADVASIRSVIEDGKNGFLVEPYNTAQVVEKLRLLLSDQVDWNDVRENAAATIKERFSIDDYIEKLESIYEEIARNN